MRPMPYDDGFETTNLPAPRQITWLRLSSLTPAKRNPKTHAVSRLAGSIRTHGFADLVIIDERTQRMVAGHGRGEALIYLRQVGAPLPDGCLMDDDGEWLVPCLRGWASQDDDHAEAFIIDHNRLTEAGGWDNKVTRAILDDLNVNAPKLFDGLEFTVPELDVIFRQGEPDVSGRVAVAADGSGPGEPDPFDSGAEPGEIGQDPATKGPEPREQVRCPECGNRFRPGDRTVW